MSKATSGASVDKLALYDKLVATLPGVDRNCLLQLHVVPSDAKELHARYGCRNLPETLERAGDAGGLTVVNIVVARSDNEIERAFSILREPKQNPEVIINPDAPNA